MIVKSFCVSNDIFCFFVMSNYEALFRVPQVLSQRKTRGLWLESYNLGTSTILCDFHLHPVKPEVSQASSQSSHSMSLGESDPTPPLLPEITQQHYGVFSQPWRIAF